MKNVGQEIAEEWQKFVFAGHGRPVRVVLDPERAERYAEDTFAGVPVVVGPAFGVEGATKPLNQLDQLLFSSEAALGRIQVVQGKLNELQAERNMLLVEIAKLRFGVAIGSTVRVREDTWRNKAVDWSIADPKERLAKITAVWTKLGEADAKPEGGLTVRYLKRDGTPGVNNTHLYAWHVWKVES